MPNPNDGIIGETGTIYPRLENARMVDVYMINGVDWPTIETIQVGNIILPVLAADMSFAAQGPGVLTLKISMNRARLHMPEDPDE